MEIGIDECLITDTYSFIEKYKRNIIHVVVCDSHKHIIKSIKSTPSYENIRVVNIDYHHDSSTIDLDTLHCGNWVEHLYMICNNAEVKWVKRPDSNMEGLDCRIESYDSLGEISNILTDFIIDEIFICRSPLWTPPHLDGKFDSFIENILKILNIHQEVDLMNMWDTEFLSLIQQNEIGFDAISN